MADSQQQQVTSQTPATKPKNPNRVAAGKPLLKKQKWRARHRKKTLIEAQSIIAKKKNRMARHRLTHQLWMSPTKTF